MNNNSSVVFIENTRDIIFAKQLSKNAKRNQKIYSLLTNESFIDPRQNPDLSFMTKEDLLDKEELKFLLDNSIQQSNELLDNIILENNNLNIPFSHLFPFAYEPLLKIELLSSLINKLANQNVDTIYLPQRYIEYFRELNFGKNKIKLVSIPYSAIGHTFDFISRHGLKTPFKFIEKKVLKEIESYNEPSLIMKDKNLIEEIPSSIDILFYASYIHHIETYYPVHKELDKKISQLFLIHPIYQNVFKPIEKYSLQFITIGYFTDNFNLDKYNKLVNDYLKKLNDIKLSTCLASNKQKGMELILEYCKSQLSDVLSFHLSISNVLDQIHPSLVVTADTLTDWRSILTIEESKSRGISTLAIQEGTRYPSYYSHPIMADNYVVFGPRIKNEFIQTTKEVEKIHPFGCPRFDILRLRNKKVVKTITDRKILDFVYDKMPILLWTPVPFVGLKLMDNRRRRDYELKCVYNTIEKIPDIKLIIKLHPLDSEYVFINYLNNLNPSVQTRILIHNKGTLTDLIPHATIGMSWQSTSCIEFICADKPLIGLNLTGASDLNFLNEFDMCFYVTKSEELETAIIKILENHNLPDHLENQRKQYLKEVCWNYDGKATERVVELIRKIINNA